MRKLVTILLTASALLLTAQGASGQDFARRTVSGTVLDENGETMPGVMVTTTDGRSGVVSDEKGRFSIQVKSSDKTLSLSMLGYNVQTVNIEGKETLTVVMVPDADNTLNEVVVIG